MEMQFEPISTNKKRPFIIAGPCSAETEGQVMATAKALAEQDIDLFRAGIWKPRTRPGSFEGVGKSVARLLAGSRPNRLSKESTVVAPKSSVKYLKL